MDYSGWIYNTVQYTAGTPIGLIVLSSVPLSGYISVCKAKVY